MSTNENDFAHVKELGKSNYEIAQGDSDIRGWTVKNAQGNILGEVHDLLFDTGAKRVLYMVLDMEGNEMNLRDRKVLIPMEAVDLHEGYKNVILPGVMANELTALPTYEKGKLSTKTVDLITHTFANVRPHHEPVNADYDSGRNDASAMTGQPAVNQQPAMSSPGNAVGEASRQTEEKHEQVNKTVVGVYEHTNSAQAAVEYLIRDGFQRNNITISNNEAEKADDDGITGFFRSLFKDDEDVYKYSEAAKAGAVVSVDTFSDGQAEQAAEILDQLGALNMDERNVIREKYNSRIVLRQAPPIF